MGTLLGCLRLGVDREVAELEVVPTLRVTLDKTPKLGAPVIVRLSGCDPLDQRAFGGC